MREIVVPLEAIKATIDRNVPGIKVTVPVVVDWPELQLTSEQREANAIAQGLGQNPPHKDHSMILLVLPRWFE